MESKIEMHIENVTMDDLKKQIEKLSSENTKLFSMYRTEKRKNNRLRKRLGNDAEIVNEWISVDN
jgi:hypothetical protein|tara:strand:+ start:2444 stop:2638 length:195 start_codon:yes stop_codon:yes gene_type:complete